MKVLKALSILIIAIPTFDYTQSDLIKNSFEIGVGYLVPSKLATSNIRYFKNLKSSKNIDFGLVVSAFKSNINSFKSNQTIEVNKLYTRP